MLQASIRVSLAFIVYTYYLLRLQLFKPIKPDVLRHLGTLQVSLFFMGTQPIAGMPHPRATLPKTQNLIKTREIGLKIYGKQLSHWVWFVIPAFKQEITKTTTAMTICLCQLLKSLPSLMLFKKFITKTFGEFFHLKGFSKTKCLLVCKLTDNINQIVILFGYKKLTKCRSKILEVSPIFPMFTSSKT